MLGAAMAVSAGLTTALGAGQTIYGLSQKAKNKRPEYEIPQEVAQNLNQAQMLALQGLPAEQKQEFVNNLRQSTASGLAQIGTRKGGLAGVANLAQNERRGYQDLLIQDSAARQNNQKMLMGQRQNMADYRDQAFQFNKINPYLDKAAQSQADIGAGIQNMSQGLQSFDGNEDGLTEEQRKAKRAVGSPYVDQAKIAQQSGSFNNFMNYNPLYNKNGIVPDQSQEQMLFGQTMS